MARVINFLENLPEKPLVDFSPDTPLEYSVLTDYFEKKLLGIKWAALAGIIGIIAILFSCLFHVLKCIGFKSDHADGKFGVERKLYG